MPKRKRDTPTYRSKKAATKHGYITYGRKASGARKFKVYRVKDGWNASRR